jgi:hypothetical protein
MISSFAGTPMDRLQNVRIIPAVMKGAIFYATAGNRT